MKKIILICFLALCNGFLYGSDGADIGDDLQTIWGDLENYSGFLKKLENIQGIILKNGREEVVQYAENLGQHQEIDLISIAYYNAVMGQFIFLKNLYDRITLCDKRFGRQEIQNTIIKVPVIEESKITEEDAVRHYIRSYGEFLVALGN